MILKVLKNIIHVSLLFNQTSFLFCIVSRFGTIVMLILSVRCACLKLFYFYHFHEWVNTSEFSKELVAWWRKRACCNDHYNGCNNTLCEDAYSIIPHARFHCVQQFFTLYYTVPLEAFFTHWCLRRSFAVYWHAFRMRISLWKALFTVIKFTYSPLTYVIFL